MGMLRKWLHNAFIPREMPIYHTVSIPPLAINLLLLGLIYGAYLLVPTQRDLQDSFQTAALISTLVIIVTYLLHLKFPHLDGWLAVIGLMVVLNLLVFLLRMPELFLLQIVSLILAVFLINQYSGVVVGLLQVLVIGAVAWLQPGFFAQSWNAVLYAALLAAVTLVVTVMSAIIEGIFYQAEMNFIRLQELLAQSRQNQQEWMQMLANLERSNRQLSLLFERNITLRKEAEEAAESKTNFIAKVSHEIRTPLSVILGITESLALDQEAYGGDIPSNVLDDLNLVRRNSEHLLSLVNDILDMTRVEANQVILHREWSHVNELISSALDIVRPLAEHKNLYLRFERGENLPSILCDPTRIRQVVMNLLINAIRYTDSGGITVTIDIPEAQNLVIRVQDTGRGVAASQLERIFEPFYRSDPVGSGSGLGLSVSRQFVQLHNGRIWAESALGKGSTFFIALPLPVPADEAAAPQMRYLNPDWEIISHFGVDSGSFSYFTKPHIAILSADPEVFRRYEGDYPQYYFTYSASVAAFRELIRTTPAHLALVDAERESELLPLLEAARKAAPDILLLGTTFTRPNQPLRDAGLTVSLRKPFTGTDLRNTLTAFNAAPQSILLVEDNEDIQQVVYRMLGEDEALSSAHMYVASTAAAAEEILASQTPDLMILDLILPDTPGEKLYRRLRADQRTAKTPVVIISSQDLDGELPATPAAVLVQGRNMTLHQLLATSFVQRDLKPE